jgi:trk system potassium uptake protein TrkA
MLANRLSSQGSSVVVIDRDESAFEHLSTEFSGFRVTGDAAELAVLRQAKIDQADYLLATTSHDNVNLMVAQVAKEIFGVAQVFARIFDPSREQIYGEFGIDTICPTTLSAEAFMAAIGRPNEEVSS